MDLGRQIAVIAAWLARSGSWTARDTQSSKTFPRPDSQTSGATNPGYLLDSVGDVYAPTRKTMVGRPLVNATGEGPPSPRSGERYGEELL